MRRFTACLLIIGAMFGTTLRTANAQEIDAALLQVIESRSPADRARDSERHPAETLDVFQLQPGMTVAEVLPGGGWYTRILANYLGADATLYGVNYIDRMWLLFTSQTEEWRAARRAATKEFPTLVAGLTDNGIRAQGFTFNTVPGEAIGTVDRVLMIRALHHLNRFEAAHGTLSQALAAVRGMLKPDGLVGVVQHRLPESAPDAGADGSRGYLKQSTVVAAFQAAGFELLSSSEINANPADQPGPQDTVWRLPPTLRSSGGDPEEHAAMAAIGESDRMTLLFRLAD